MQSLYNNLNCIEILLSGEWKDVDVLCLSEHWLSKDCIDSLSMPNFFLAASYCRETLSHGGVSIYCKDNLHFVPGLDLSELNLEKDFEHTSIILPQISTIIICIYRTPDGNLKNFDKNLELLLNSFFDPNFTIVICGDRNIDFLVDSNEKKNLLNITNSYNLIATVNSATRITKFSRTAPDQILVHSIYTHYTSIFDAGFSDHRAQIITIDINLKFARPILNKMSRSFN